MIRLASFAWQKAVLLGVMLTFAATAEGGVIAFTDRAAFLAALGGPATLDNYESYVAGDVVNGSTLGDFTYGFDPSLVQPTVTTGAFGGQALGGSPNDVFVGGNEVTLTFGSQTLRAFGADFYYGPAFDHPPADLYRVLVRDGSAAGSFAGNPILDFAGGSFFLGLIADPGSEFSAVSLLSVVPTDANGDPTFLVPAYQVDNLAYGTVSTVPEPSSLLLLLTGCGVVSARRARSAASRNGAVKR